MLKVSTLSVSILFSLKVKSKSLKLSVPKSDCSLLKDFTTEYARFLNSMMILRNVFYKILENRQLWIYIVS